MSTAAISSSIVKASTPVAAAKPQPAAAQAKTAAHATAASQAAASATAAISAQAAALKEVTETNAQTVKEAAGGDRQAQKLLARESAARNGSASAKSAPASTKGSRISVKA